MNIDNQISTDLLRREIGVRIANMRVLAHLKQSELAERSGISRFCLSRIENGIGGVNFDSVLAVWRQLGILSSLALMLPEPTIPLHDLVKEESRKRKSLPKRVRDRKEKKTSRTWTWGEDMVKGS